VLRTVRDREPETRLGAIGFSLGANALLKQLGESGEDTVISAAVAVSAPYDLAACSGRLNSGFSKVYSGWLLGMVFRSVRSKRALIEEAGVNVDAVLASKTLRELDDRLIAPLHDFEDADDYYAKSSCQPFVKEITCPTLLVHGIDDPFLRPDIVPEEAECGPLVERCFSQRGGHVGFLEGKIPGQARSWLAGPPMDWLASKLSE
jgi:predicted alpha/beta-fold hydrolase